MLVLGNLVMVEGDERRRVVLGAVDHTRLDRAEDLPGGYRDRAGTIASTILIMSGLAWTRNFFPLRSAMLLSG